MEATAITRYLRIAPRKIRLVIDTIRHKPVAEAFSLLANMKKKGARMAEKTLKSAHANAKVKKMDESRLYVKKIVADGGPSLKRYMSRSMGRADVILKRMTHLTVVLGESLHVRSALQPAEKKGKHTGLAPLAKKTKQEKKKKTAGAAR